MQRHSSLRYLAVVASIAIAMPPALRAQAFGINEIGTCALSRGFAVTGSPCQDASAIFWNPGATGATKGWSVLAGAAVISLKGGFTQDTTFRRFDGTAPTAVVPHVFASYTPADSRLSYGLGVYVPYGLTSQWGDSFPGRFQALKAAIQTLYVQPNVAYRINDTWSVGGGPVIGRSTVELRQALDLSTQVASAGPPVVLFSQLGIAKRTEFGRATLKGSAMAYGAHVGIFGNINPRWTVGLRFLTPLEFSYNDADATFTQTKTGLVLAARNPICYPAGTNPICGGNPNATVAVDQLVAASFASGGPLVAQKVKTKITHPAQIQGGFGYSGFTNWLLSADYTWTGWRRFDELPIEFTGPASVSNRVLIEDYNNTSSVRLGAQRSFTGGAQLRLGFAGVASAAPDETVTPLLPEQDRSYVTLGGSYPFMDRFTVEAAYLRVMTPGRRGRVDERNSRTIVASQINSGKYDLSANVFSIGLKASY